MLSPPGGCRIESLALPGHTPGQQGGEQLGHNRGDFEADELTGCAAI